VVDGDTKPQRPFHSRLSLFCALSFFVPFAGTTAAATATTTNAIAPLSHRLLPFLSFPLTGSFSHFLNSFTPQES
jgi:hypothetical protein